MTKATGFQQPALGWLCIVLSSTTWRGLGYKGIQRDLPELGALIPFKKPRGGELTPEQKKFNRALSNGRVVVERAFSRMKEFRVMREKFRNRLKNYDTMTDTTSGLTNIRTLGL